MWGKIIKNENADDIINPAQLCLAFADASLYARNCEELLLDLI